MGFDESPGTNKLANVLSRRIKKEKEAPLILDFGEIQENESLLTNTFPVPIPKGDYSVCRQLTLGETGDLLTEIEPGGRHEGHNPGTGEHEHEVPIPEGMRSVMPGDRVLVAWVQNEAVVIDIIIKS